jgi:hypothetical protein
MDAHNAARLFQNYKLRVGTTEQMCSEFTSSQNCCQRAFLPGVALPNRLRRAKVSRQRERCGIATPSL